MPEIDTIGRRIFEMILDAGFWIILIMGAINALKCIMKGDFEGSFKSAVAAALSFVGLNIIPILLNWIKEVFK